MAHIVHDFVRESTDTTGTGTTISLTGAVDESLPFSEVMQDGDTCDYYIHEPGVGREAGEATYVAASNELTLAVRNSVSGGVESASRLNLQGGAKIGIGAAGEKTKFAKSLALWSTGDVKPTFKAVADDGWVIMDDGTIGNGASGASTRANADTEALFKLLWDNISDTYATVSGGRGASAQADFDADKTITLPKVLGRAFIGAGTGSGLTARALGESGGQEDAIVVSHNHGSGTLATNNDTHSHGSGSLATVLANDATGSIAGSVPGEAATGGTFPVDGSTAGDTHSHSVTGGSTSSAGSTGVDKNMQPFAAMNVMIKL